MVSMAMDNGINFFDTADSYSEGVAESMLGNALAGKRSSAVIVTKLAPRAEGYTKKHVIEGCEASLKRLKTDYIDIYEFHIFDKESDIYEGLEALDSLVSSGKIRYSGCSNYSGWQLMKSAWISEVNGLAKFATVEAKYSLLLRELENELIPACLDQGIGILAFSPMYAGFLTGKYSRNKPWPTGTRFPSATEMARYPVKLDRLYDIVDVLEKIAAAHGRPVSHVSLNYLLHKPAVCSLITAARNVEQLAANLDATDWDLSEEEIAELDRVSEPDPLYPYSQQNGASLAFGR